MENWGLITILYLVGLVVLVAELFIPSHGLLGLLSAGLWGYAVVLTFGVSRPAGMAALISVAVVAPVFIWLWAKYWPRPAGGRRSSPRIGVLPAEDRMPGAELEALVGRTGRTLGDLRPVGLAMFEGKRIECRAEYGVINRDVEVRGLRVVDRTLEVRPTETKA